MKRVKISKKKNIVAVVFLLTVFVVTGVLVFLNYLNKTEHEVIFFSDSGRVLRVEKVHTFDSATPPVEPQMTYGKMFKSWDKDFYSIKKDLEINPIVTDFTDKSNVFALPGTYGRVDEYITVPFKLCGDVCLSGFDVSITYDSSVLKFDSVYNEDGAVVYNSEKDGVIHFNYVSLGNTIGDVDICSLKFKIIKEVEQTDIKVSVNGVYANKTEEELYIPETTVIDATVYISPKKEGDVGG